MVTYLSDIVQEKKTFFKEVHLSIQPTMAAVKRLDLLLKWLDDNKVEWDKDVLEIKEINGSFGVYAKKNMKKDKPGKRVFCLLYNVLATHFLYSCKDPQGIDPFYQDNRYCQPLG